ncbi:MAG: sialate O-acetylesterase [Verrucomicrobiota bacterium]
MGTIEKPVLAACLLFWSFASFLRGAEPADTNYDESKTPAYTLTALFPKALSDNQRAEHWKRARRSEVLALFEQHVYGKTPDEPVTVVARETEWSESALNGTAARRQIRLTLSPKNHPDRSLDIDVLIYHPAKTEKPVPAFIGLNFYGNQTVHPDPAIQLSKKWMRGNGEIGIVNHRATERTRGVYEERWQVERLIKRGYGLVTVYCGDLDPDNYQHDFTDGAHPLFYKPGQKKPADDEWGAIGAWAWGLSQIRQWLETEISAIDAKRLAVIGHSRLGKTALWAGAQDENFALVISNNSGCGGAALFRRCYGERIHHMIKPVGYWFCRNHATFAKREADLPVDQHMLMSLVAPRPLYVASAENDRWADPKGEFLAAKGANPVYRALGKKGLLARDMPRLNQPVSGTIGYHYRQGNHAVTDYDWSQYLAFADTHLKENPTEFVARTSSDLRLAGIFSDHMVLQQKRPIPVLGQATPESTVTLTFAHQTLSTRTNEKGHWEIRLGPMVANAQGQNLNVTSNGQTHTIKDVVIGEVWHASGQSNMAMTVGSVAKRLPEVQQQIEAATHPELRFTRIKHGAERQPRTNLPKPCDWTTCSPRTVGSFPAAAYFFARKLQSELGVPIGIIDTSRGGTPIEPFIPRSAFKGHPTLIREGEFGDADDLKGIWDLVGGVYARDANWLPGRLFNTRLAPVSRFPIRGAIWYQGESNCGVREDPRYYQHKMRALISGWREAFQHADLPFYFVQLPGSGARSGWPYLREQQRLSLNLPHTGMAVTIDLLDSDIHPPNKVDVGHRLAQWALAKTYGRDFPYSGPLFQRATFQGHEATVHFQHAESGLMAAVKEGLAEPVEKPGLKLAHFEVVGSDGQWHAANARISGNTVKVQSNRVWHPVAVRYGYAIDPRHCHLYNKEGLPAAPFCSSPEFLSHDPHAGALTPKAR